MQLARAASLTTVSRQTVVSRSSLVMSRRGCSTRRRKTANALDVSGTRCSPHHAHSLSASMRTAGGSPGRAWLIALRRSLGPCRDREPERLVDLEVDDQLEPG